MAPMGKIKAVDLEMNCNMIEHVVGTGSDCDVAQCRVEMMVGKEVVAGYENICVQMQVYILKKV
jgi:hypothetical protein